MNSTPTRLTSALAVSLKENSASEAGDLLEHDLVNLYDFEGVNPAEVILDAGRSSGNMALLRTLVEERLANISRVQIHTAIEFMRVNTLFDLARDLFLDKQGPGREKVVAVLEKVWQEHALWRLEVGKAFLEDGELFS